VPTAKSYLDDAIAIRPPRPSAIRRDRDWHHCAAIDRRLRQQLSPPSEQLVAVHIMTPRHDRHRCPWRLRLRHHLALQRFRILSTLRRARLVLSVHYAGSGHLFCLIRHPLIIAPIAAQWQALFAERLQDGRICHRTTLSSALCAGSLSGGAAHGCSPAPTVAVSAQLQCTL